MANKEYRQLFMRPKGNYMHDGFVKFLDALKKHECKKILEIGSYGGESLNMFKDKLGQDVTVVCIDPWCDMPDSNDILLNQDLTVVEDVFNENSKSLTKYGKLKFYSQDISDMFADGYFDCIYIDGLHTYEQVMIDILKYSPKVRSGGIIAGHDIEIEIDDHQRNFHDDIEGIKRMRKSVTRAVHSFFKPDSITTFPDSSWLTFKS